MEQRLFVEKEPKPDDGMLQETLETARRFPEGYAPCNLGPRIQRARRHAGTLSLRLSG